jgi:hypothetical protein
VTGLDRDPAILEIARREDPGVHWVEGAEATLPGCRRRRHPMWRYSVVWAT